MPNPYGTALQVLAGAFGGGATSLGQSRIEQNRIDTNQSRQDARFAVEDAQWDKDYQLQKAQNAARQAAIDLERKREVLGENAYAAVLAERGFPPEMIQAVLHGKASVAQFLGPRGMYSAPGDPRGVGRATTPAAPAAPSRFPSVSGAGAKPAPPPAGGTRTRRPPPDLP